MARFVPGEGNPSAVLMLVGEGPGAEEDRRGRPFVGKSGRLLDDFLWKIVGIQRRDVYVTNLVKFRVPDDGDPSDADVERDKGILEKELRDVGPVVVATLGRWSTRYFLGDVDMEVVHGLPFLIEEISDVQEQSEKERMAARKDAQGDKGAKKQTVRRLWKTVSLLRNGFRPREGKEERRVGDDAKEDRPANKGRGKEVRRGVRELPSPKNVESKQPFIVLPVYHPAAGLHSTEFQGLTAWDFQQLKLVLDGKLEPRGLPEDEYPNPTYLRIIDGAHAPSESAIVAIDTEGSAEEPWGLSGTDSPGFAVVAKSLDKIHPDTRVILHNSMHDLGVLRAMGIELADDQFEDTMVMSYLLCVEPQGLKPLARRHCGMEMRDYWELVGPYDRAKKLAWLKRAQEILRG